MKITTLRSHHKWLGLCLSLFLLLFCVSGVLLNHREAIEGVNVGRGLLPKEYHYRNWNNGLLRGSVGLGEGEVLIYGSSGLWLKTAEGISDFNTGLPASSDRRGIRTALKTESGMLLAVASRDLYIYDENRSSWASAMSTNSEEMFTDMAMRGDTLHVLSRSYIYVSLPPYERFERVDLPPPPGYKPRVSLFRTVWLLHGGGLWGMVGKLVVDAVAVVLVFLCITGLLYWFMPGFIRRLRKRNSGKDVLKKAGRSMQWFYKTHKDAGRLTIILTLVICFTGWCLRPPVLIALATVKTAPLPGTVLSDDNPWHDKLRSLRYDHKAGEWLMYTSDGFFSMPDISSVPTPLRDVPPVSVMGTNVLHQDTASGHWLVGSFSGMYVWDRASGAATDYFTGRPAEKKAGPPVGDNMIAGYSPHLGEAPLVADYNKGVSGLPMPDELRLLPMSLWHLSLEVHTGRIFTFLGMGVHLYIFVTGLAIMWCLWSGYAMTRRGKRRGIE